MNLTETENMQNWIGHMTVEEFASWLAEFRNKAYYEGYSDGAYEEYMGDDL